MANKAGNPSKAAGYFNKIQALANLGGTWGKLLYSVDDGAGDGSYTVTSASANFLTGCGGTSCAGNILSLEARNFTITSVLDAHTVVLNHNNPAPNGTNLKVRIFATMSQAGINIALIYDWLYKDLSPAVRAEFLNELDVLCTEWEENYIGIRASPMNDVFYIDVGPYGLIGALAIYPDHPNGMNHLKFASDIWFNTLLPVWNQVFGPEGGGWHEAWPDYVNAPSGTGLTRFLVPTLLCWQVATGDPIFAREPWLKNFAYYTMYMTRPDFVLENIGDISRPYLTREYNIPSGAGLGSLNGLAEIYDDPVIRGWARLVNQESPAGPDGFEPSAWPFYKPDNNSNAVSSHSALSLVHNFTGWGVLSARTGWSEDDTSVTLKYGDNFWSHEHADIGSFTIFNRGSLALDSGSYRPGYSSKHETQYARQAIAHNTLTITDPADVYPTGFLTTDEFGNRIQLPLSNDGGQRRVGSPYNQHFPQLTSPLGLGQWMQNWDYYHMGQMVGLASTPSYTYTAVDMTAAYNNQFSATAPNASNRTDRVQKAVRHLVMIPRGTAAYVVVFDQVTSTNASFVKRWLLHSVNRPTVSGNSFQIVRNELVTPKPYISGWLNYPLKYKKGAGSALQYQYDGKLYGWMVQPQQGTISVVGGPGKEFWIEDPLHPGTGTNWNQCMPGQCAANSEGLGPVNDFINPDPTTAPHEPGSWRIEVKPTTPSTQDYFLHVMLATTAQDTNVPVTVKAPANLPPGWVGATWTDSGHTYTISFPQSGVSGHVTITGVVDESLLAHAQPLPADLSIVSGNGQSGTTGMPLPSALIVSVKDSAGNPLPGAAVHFALTKGNGTVSADTVLTDNQGLASVNFTPGVGTSGSPLQVMADVNGLAPVAFDATLASGGTSVPVVSSRPTSTVSARVIAATTSAAVIAKSDSSSQTAKLVLTSASDRSPGIGIPLGAWTMVPTQGFPVQTAGSVAKLNGKREKGSRLIIRQRLRFRRERQ